MSSQGIHRGGAKRCKVCRVLLECFEANKDAGVGFPSHSHSHCPSAKAYRAHRHDMLFSALKTTDHLVPNPTGRELLLQDISISTLFFITLLLLIKRVSLKAWCCVRLSNWQPWSNLSLISLIPRGTVVESPLPTMTKSSDKEDQSF